MVAVKARMDQITITNHQAHSTSTLVTAKTRVGDRVDTR